MALSASGEPVWQKSTVLVVLLGLLWGGFLGVLAGFAGGLTLRLMRRVPLILAAPAAALTVALTVSVSLFLLGWTSPSIRSGFPLGLIAGVAAAVTAPWIRHWPR